MKCLLDLDGVLVDFMSGACELHGYPESKSIDRISKTFAAKLFGLSDIQFFSAMDHSFWSGLRWTEYGRDVLDVIRSFFSDKDICLCTAPTPISSSGCISGKLAWIERELPNFSRRFMITSCKYFSAHPAVVLVDDRSENCNEFVAHGGHAVLVPNHWNHMFMINAAQMIKLLKENLQSETQ